MRQCTVRKNSVTVHSDAQLGDGRATVAFNEREKVIERLRFTTIHLDKLDANQMDFFKSIWSDLVEFTNQSLIIPPFRREPP